MALQRSNALSSAMRSSSTFETLDNTNRTAGGE
jgi:hypothetical protein